MNVKFTKAIFGTIVGSLSILILGFIYLTFKYPSIGPDTSYYLSIARDMAEGNNYYTDIASVYPPFIFWFYSLFMKYLGFSSISAMFVINYVIYIINTLLFFKITYFFGKDIKERIVFSLLFLAVLFNLDGMHILLEVFVLLFQLILTYVLFFYKHSLNPLILILTGFLAFLAFYSKQYGMVVIPAVLLYLYQPNKKLYFIQSFWFLFGFFGPILFIIMLNAIAYNMSFKIIIFRLLGITENKDFIITGAGYSFSGLIATLTNYLKLFPFLILMVFVIPKATKSKEIQYMFVLIVGASFTLFFAYYPHYFQLIIPYMLFLVFAVVQTHVEYKYLFVALFISTGVKLFIFFNSEIKPAIQLTSKLQTDVTQKLNTIAPRGTKVFLFGPSTSYYYYCGFKSANLKELGYAFPNQVPFDKFSKYIDNDAYVISALPNYKKIHKANFKAVKAVKINDKKIYALFKNNNK